MAFRFAGRPDGRDLCFREYTGADDLIGLRLPDAGKGVAPDVIALGPIYETKLKAMAWAPQGLARIGAWRAAIAKHARVKRTAAPVLVAIGGLTPERAPRAFAAGAQSLAVVTDFLMHPNPERRISEWLAVTKEPG